MFSQRPSPDDYQPFHAGYVDAVPDGGWRERLTHQPADYRARLGGWDDARAAEPLAAGKWSLHDVLTHVCDAERVFAFRLLWFARVPGASLPGFEQDDWAVAARNSRRTVRGLLDEFAALRTTSIALIDGLPDEVVAHAGIASNGRVTVHAIAWILVGHAEHHLRLLAARPS